MLEILSNPTVDGVCDEEDLELGKDPFPKTTVANCLKRIGSKKITYENSFPLRYQALILERQVKYVEDIVIIRDTANLGMPRKEVIQVISDTGKEIFNAQADNHLDYLIQEKRMKI